MALLKCWWKFDEAAGSPTAYEYISSNHAQLSVVSGYPRFVPGYAGNGIEGNGAVWNTGGHLICDKVAYDLCSLADPHSFTFWLKLPVGAARNRVIFTPWFGSPTPFATNPIYVDSSGYVRYGVSYYSQLTLVRETVSTGIDLRDGEWHFYAVTFYSDPGRANCNQKIYVDGQLKGTLTPNPLLQVSSETRDGHTWWILNGYLVGFPINAAYGFGGTLQGILDDLRFYCGELGPDEVFPPVPPKISSIMFSCNT